MIIKATRLQAWAPAEGGGGKSRPPAPHRKEKKFFDYIGGLFATFSSYGALFATFFLIFGGPFHHVGAFLLLITLWWGPSLGRAPPYENFCGLP